MKNRIFRTLLTLALALFTLPMLSQDFMNIYFKNGDFRKFYMKNITEIAASKVDSEGVQHSDYCYQRITTIFDTYIYSLEDVDSITFTKIDEEKAEHNFVTAMTEAFPAISSCETITDAEKIIDNIKAAQGIADAWSDGHQLYIAIEEGEVISFHFNHSPEVDEKSLKENVDQTRAMLPQLANMVKQDGTQLKAVIANVQDKDENRKSHKTDYFDPLIKAFRLCGIDAHYVDSPKIDFFCENSNDPTNLSLYDYDLIFLVTHGKYDRSRIWTGSVTDMWNDRRFDHAFFIAPDEDLGMELKVSEDPSDEISTTVYNNMVNWRANLKYKDLTDQHISYGFAKELHNGKWYWVGFPELTEHFIRDYATGTFKNPNSVLFNVSCQSIMGEDDNTPSFTLAEEFTKKGLGVYLGYDQTNSVGQEAGFHFFTNMVQGMSLQQSYEKLSDADRNENRTEKDGTKYVASLFYYPQNNEDVKKMFLFSPTTVAVNSEDVNSEFKKSQTVTVNGSAILTNYDSKRIKAGFTLSLYEFGQNNIGPKKYIDAEIKPVNYSNKVEFAAKFTDLEPDKKYAYRAYTYDGKHYNYGDFCFFSIDGGTTPRPDINLTTGTKFITRTKEDVEVTYTVITNDRNNDKYTCKIENGANTGQGGIRLRRANGAIAPAISPDTEGTVTIPESAAGFSVTEVGTNAFLDCGKVTVINLPETIEEIDESAMSGCIGLSSITIPKNVKTISRNAFGGCKNVKSIYAEMTIPFTINENVFQTAAEEQSGTATSIFANVTLYVPVGSKNQYATTPGWNRFQRIDEYTPGGENPDPGPGGDIIAYTSCPDDHHPHLIDLGLPSGTKWACCNVGASKPEDYGGYYAWGETDEKEVYNWETYKYGSSFKDLTYVGNNISGTIYDAATFNWGESWCMPTINQFNELMQYCSCEWKSLNGVMGQVFTSPNRGSIFIAAAGSRQHDRFVILQQTEGIYWTSDLVSNDEESAWTPYFSSEKMGISYMSRYCGHPIRPVASTIQTIMPKGCPDENHPHMIDLGLPSGTKWACCNVGANKPEECGDYYAFGETGKKNAYYDVTYQYYDSSKQEMMLIGNYIEDPVNYLEGGYYDISGTDYDAATVHWGALWHMPTKAQFRELVTNTTSEMISKNGERGQEFTGPNGRTIFLPYAGEFDEDHQPVAGYDGNYWTSQIYGIGFPWNCECLSMHWGTVDADGIRGRWCGLSIRPVSSTGGEMPSPGTNDDSIITFADPKVKALCVANWDTNGDGQLSRNEAAAVTDLGQVFANNSELASFDELQYFTGLTSIGNSAFLGCKNLAAIIIPNSVKTIESYSFNGCKSLVSVTIPKGVIYIVSGAFWNCSSLVSFDVEEGNSVYYSENGILFDKNMTTIMCYPNGKPETTYAIPTSVTNIDNCAFADSYNLTSIIMPESVTRIGNYAFAHCHGLTSFTIGNSVTSIGEGAFQQCNNLNSLTIPNSVTNIERNAFEFCDNLSEIISYIEEPFALNKNVFLLTDKTHYSNATLYVPAGTKTKYEATEGWNKLTNIVEME